MDEMGISEEVNKKEEPSFLNKVKGKAKEEIKSLEDRIERFKKYRKENRKRYVEDRINYLDEEYKLKTKEEKLAEIEEKIRKIKKDRGIIGWLFKKEKPQTSIRGKKSPVSEAVSFFGTPNKKMKRMEEPRSLLRQSLESGGGSFNFESKGGTLHDALMGGDKKKKKFDWF